MLDTGSPGFEAFLSPAPLLVTIADGREIRDEQSLSEARVLLRYPTRRCENTLGTSTMKVRS